MPAAGSVSVLRYDFPENNNAEYYPQPEDPRVRLGFVSASRSASIWFFGAPTPQRIVKQLAALKDFLTLQGETPATHTQPQSLRISRHGVCGLMTRISVDLTVWPAFGPIRRHSQTRRASAPFHVLPTS
jgi:hypothetical protein